MIGPKARIGFPFLLAGLIFAAAFATFTYRSMEIVWEGATATGEITGMQTVSGYRGQSHLPVVRFNAADGTQRVFWQRPGGRRGAYSIGEKVTVLYLPDDPGRAIIDSFWGRYGFIFATLFALCFAALGGWLVWQDRRENAIFDR